MRAHIHWLLSPWCRSRGWVWESGMRANGPLEVCGSYHGEGGWQTYKVSRRQAERRARAGRKGGSLSVRCSAMAPATPDSRKILGPNESRGIPDRVGDR